MKILHELETWIEATARWRASSTTAFHPGPLEGMAPPPLVVSALGGPGVGKSTFLNACLAFEAPQYPAHTVSLAFREPKAYLQSPRRWTQVQSVGLLDLLRGGDAAPSAAIAFGMQLEEVWGVAVSDQVPLHGPTLDGWGRDARRLRVLVLRAEAPMSRVELEGLRQLHGRGLAPDLLLVNTRGPISSEDLQEVKSFVSEQAEGVGSTAPVLVVDVANWASKGTDGALLARMLGQALLAGADAPAFFGAAERAGLGNPASLVERKARLQERAKAAWATGVEPARATVASCELSLAKVKAEVEAERTARADSYSERRSRLEGVAAPSQSREEWLKLLAAAVAPVPLPAFPAPPLSASAAMAVVAGAAGLLGLAGLVLDWTWTGAAMLLVAAGAAGRFLAANREAKAKDLEACRAHALTALNAAEHAEFEELREQAAVASTAAEGRLVSARQAEAVAMRTHQVAQGELEEVVGHLAERSRLARDLQAIATSYSDHVGSETHS